MRKKKVLLMKINKREFENITLKNKYKRYNCSIHRGIKFLKNYRGNAYLYYNKKVINAFIYYLGIRSCTTYSGIYTINYIKYSILNAPYISKIYKAKDLHIKSPGNKKFSYRYITERTQYE